MLLALTTDQKFGLAGTAAIFIVFSLLVALVIPRTRPDFPGRRGLVPFILVAVILTIAMLGAVEVFAKEEHHGAATHEPEPTETTPTETSPEAPPPPPAPTTTAEEPSGSPEEGKAVFASGGCGGCHAFTPAGSSGTTGPNLGEVLAGADAASIRQSIVEPDAEIAAGFSAGVMPKTYKDQLTPDQIDNLVAFLMSR